MVTERKHTCLATVLPTNFREMAKRDGFPPGNDTEALTRASLAGIIYTAPLGIIADSGEMTGHLPGPTSRGTARASSRCGAVAGHLALAAPLARAKDPLHQAKRGCACSEAAIRQLLCSRRCDRGLRP